MPVPIVQTKLNKLMPTELQKIEISVVFICISFPICAESVE